ncbi:MAG: hypothetical protein C1943_09565 [Halochromatium sp.]|nr:hypothetical protein [Halochromatium sp.]
MLMLLTPTLTLLSRRVVQPKHVALWLLAFLFICVDGAAAKGEVPPRLWDAFDHARHAIVAEGAEATAVNHRNDHRLHFSDWGLQVRSTRAADDWHWGLTLSGYGTPGRIDPVGAAQTHIDGTRLEYRRGALTEWYINRSIGLEHGFTLTRPPHPGAEQVVLALEVHGDLSGQWREPGQALAFYTPAGEYVLSYDKLEVLDADGHRLPAQMALMDTQLAIQFDATNARWPIEVDPLVSDEQKVLATDGSWGDHFGFSVAIDGDTALIGAYKNDVDGVSFGAAYVFTRSNGLWSEQAKLRSRDGNTSTFGISVALDGDTALVGAPDYYYDGITTGAVFVFTRSGGVWSEQTKLIRPAAASINEDGFGRSVALDGDTALIGAADHGFNGEFSGAAYVFTRSGEVWTQQAKLLASDGAPGDWFGRSVALHGDTALIGAPYSNELNGAAYVFSRLVDDWSQHAKLLASDGAVGDEFGISVALDGDTALIGALYDDDNGGESGAAYVIARRRDFFDLWVEQAKLLPRDGAGGDEFGIAVALDGDTALIGAANEVSRGQNSGAAYVFTHSNGLWSEQSKLLASDGAEADHFGWSVALDGDTALIGAPDNDDYGSFTGSSYFISLSRTISPAPHPINDTGIDWCADDNANNLACPVSAYPGQDGDSGRDVNDNNPNDGQAGFSFTKLDANGQELPADATGWSCVRDNVTGAVWEVKTDDGGLRDKDWKFSWYDSDSPDGGLGLEDGGECFTDGRCDTEKYVEDINAQGLCGLTDWRLPSVKELTSITHFGRSNPAIDTSYFPNTQPTVYWTTMPSASNYFFAWSTHYYHGQVGAYYKFDDYSVRLVHAGQTSLPFVDNGDGTITDPNTGLMWERCVYGRTGIDCFNGSASEMTWQEALTNAQNASRAGYNDWRLPNVKELQSLVDYGALGPAAAIDERFFPETPSGYFWSSSPSALEVDSPWSVHSRYGQLVEDPAIILDDSSRYVRFVRTPQTPPLLSYPLADTGIDWCADGDTNNLACPVNGYPGQDGDSGRDATDNDPNDGDAGFSYTKLDANGQDLPADAADWSCVRDNVTGSIWEVKTNDGGPRDRDWIFSWYDSDSPDGVLGTEDGGNCFTAGRCDTEKYVQDINAEGLCGFTDWRLPTVQELTEIIHLGRSYPAIDTGYFPHTLSSSRFWSSSPDASRSGYAWLVYFNFGNVDSLFTNSPSGVRLVRAEQRSFPFVDNGDGTITDANTGLMWSQCSAGQSGSECASGLADTMHWDEALTYAENATHAGYDDWRLPNRKELQSLIDYSAYGPAINEQFFPFPGTITELRFWSSSPSATFSNNAGRVNFFDGDAYDDNKRSDRSVRLVRDQDSSALSLNISVSGSGTITSDPPGIDCGSTCTAGFAPGTEVTLNASPDDGFQLSGWSKADCGTALTCSITMDVPKTVTATFSTTTIGDECATNALTVENLDLTSGSRNIRSETSLDVAGSVQIGAGASLTLGAPTISFAPGFRVALGGQLSATAGSVTCAATTSTRQDAPVSAAKRTHDASTAKPPHIYTSVQALSEWVKTQLTSLGIDLESIVSSLLDADEHWLIVETPQALVTSDANRTSDIYRIDFLTQQLALISAGDNGHAGNGPSRYPAADASGELIVFHSEANNLLPSDTNGVSDLFLRDLALGQTSRLTDAEQASANPALDESAATLVYDQRTLAGPRQVFAQALAEGAAVELLSFATTADGARLDNHHPALSADGRFLVYLEETVTAGEGVTQHGGQRCQLHLYERSTQRYHLQPCPAALAEASDQARLSFSPNGEAILCSLPGQAQPLSLPNPLHPDRR